MGSASATMQGGIDHSGAYGLWDRVTVLGTWAAGDSWSMTLTDLTGSYTIGTGRVTGAVPSFALAFKNRIYFAGGSTLFFSQVGEGGPREMEQQSPSAGFIQLTNNSGTSESVMALASYQGKLAVFSRRGIQIWECSPDPAQFNQSQVLPNIGTVAPYSVQAVGDMDVYFLADSGVRSLRVRDSSNNAMVVDIGTPIDSLLQGVMAGMTEAHKAAACGVVEPTANRYWLFLKDKIYVLSYFPSAGIAAWSTYTPTIKTNTGEGSFTPIRFQVLQGCIYALAADGRIYKYGGASGNVYDETPVTWQTPWLSANTPGTRKQARGCHVAFEGSWAISFGMDPDSGSMRPVYNGTKSSFWGGVVPTPGQGTHFSLKGVSSGTGYARFSHALFTYEQADIK